LMVSHDRANEQTTIDRAAKLSAALATGSHRPSTKSVD
jgi:hypothetical protein